MPAMTSRALDLFSPAWWVGRFRPYNHLPGYLHRWRIVGFGRFMARIHHILDIDRTPFLHSHPFGYISIILRGGYDERVLLPDGSLKVIRRRAGSIVFRSAHVMHRIDAVHGRCTTLFLALRLRGSGQNWSLCRHNDVAAPSGYVEHPDGLYQLPDGWRRRAQGVWYALRPTRTEAAQCDRISIHQVITAPLTLCT